MGVGRTGLGVGVLVGEGVSDGGGSAVVSGTGDRLVGGLVGDWVGVTAGIGGSVVGNGVEVAVIRDVGVSMAVGTAPLHAMMPKGISASPAIRLSLAARPSFQPRSFTVLG